MLNNDSVTTARRDEAGAIMIMFAVMIVMLFGFMALAVDVAHAHNERRESQSTADVAAVGGALQAIDSSKTEKETAKDVIDEAMAIAADNLGAGLDWENCKDPDKFATSGADLFTLGNDTQYTECISWTSDFAQVRVKIPTRDVDTFFAKVIGFDTVPVNAFAEVGQVVGGGGGVLPFGLLGGPDESLVCLKTGPQFPPECDPNASGNFHFIDFRIYGNSAMGTVSTGCTGGTVDTVKENIAHGIDHDLAPAPSSPTDHSGINGDITIIKDDKQCPDNSKASQAALTETGNKQKVLIDGFINGINGFPGRLALGSPARTYNYNGVDVDDVGLWEYLRQDMDPGTPGIQANPCAGSTDEDSIAACVNAHPGEVLFDDTIGKSGRLARVPKLWQTTWPSGTKYISFQSFTFVYIQTIYGACQNSGSCKLEFAPNETYKVTSDDPTVITAIVIPDLTISTDVRANFGVPRVTTYAITR